MVVLKEFEYRFYQVDQDYLGEDLKKNIEKLCTDLFNEYVVEDVLYADLLFEIMDNLCRDSRIIIGHYIEECLEKFNGKIESEALEVL